MAYYVPSIDTRIETIAQRLANTEENFRQQRMPGLQAVLNDYIDPNIDTDTITFHRGLLQVFKKSQDSTYEQILNQHTFEEQKKIESFVAGEKIENVGRGFFMGPSIGCRQEIERLHQAESILHISGAGVKHIKGLNISELRTLDGGWFHDVVHKLSEFFHSGTDDVLVRPSTT